MGKINFYSKLFLYCILWTGLLLFSINLFTANINSLYAQCDPVRIMPLGDSITYGAGSGGDPNVIGGYRGPLYDALSGAGYNIDFVGSRTDYPGSTPPPDIDHEGWSGRTTDTLMGNIYNWLGMNEADIILLHTGTNDLGGDGQNTNEIIAEIEELLDEIDRYESDNSNEIMVVLARIMSFADNNCTLSQEVTELNIAIQNLADTRIAKGDKIIVVDMAALFNYPEDYSGCVHPSLTGYTKMAVSGWYPAIIDYLSQVCPLSSIPLVISNLTVASGKAYEVVEDGLLNGATVYIDRSYTYSSVPVLLQGDKYIKTANNDKGSSNASFLTFEVNQDVITYIAHDDAIGTRPSWLTSSFSDTGDNLVTTDTTLSIFESSYLAGTVTLGGNEGGNNSMYSVIIVGQGVNQAPDGAIDTPVNQTINEGNSVDFTGTGTDPDNNTPLTYQWNFGAGSGIVDSAQEDPGLVQFNSPGTFVVTFTVTDALGLSDPTPDTRTITVQSSSGGAPFLISNLTAASGKNYEAVENGLLNGATVYIDRSYTYSSVPALLQGDTYIKTANNDKGSSNASFLTFEVNQDVIIYIAHDDAIGTRPSWLTSSFSDTGDNLVTTDTTLSIFESNYLAGTVTLGGNEGGNNSMYSAIIVKQGGSGGANQAPDGAIDTPVNQTINEGDSVDFTGTGTDPDNNTPLTYQWNFSAGSGIVDSAQEDPGLVQFNSPGTFVVTFTVTDALGLFDPTPDTRTITVQSSSGGIPLVISNLAAASGKNYEAVENGLLNGALTYIDRSYTYSSVPALLQGATYIKTANNDKGSSNASFLIFEVNQDVIIYVAHDDAIGTRPSWLTSSFSDTGDNLVTTDTTLSIFEGNYLTGTITLGGNEGSGDSMYSVIIVGQ